MSKTVIIECDLCGKKLSEDDVITAEVVMNGRQGTLDFCDDCAPPLLEKLGPSLDLECPDCGKTFKNEHGVVIHRVRIHGVHPNRK